MGQASDKSISKFMSLVLCHDPAAGGLELDAGGWAEIDALLSGLRAAGRGTGRDTLERIVRESDKARFALSRDKTRIRAVQGHSVEVDLGLTPSEPPERLFHGTARRNVASILAEGLHAGNRQYVHLSGDAKTAQAVGRRHGGPVVLLIDAARAFQSGQPFWQAENGVWLTRPLAPEFILEGET